MSTSIKTALLAFALIGGSLTLGSAAKADSVTIATGPGGIAFGYDDGYWDREHRWHEWRNHEEAERWRAENREHYFARRHDREEHEGWRDDDRWWDRH